MTILQFECIFAIVGIAEQLVLPPKFCCAAKLFVEKPAFYGMVFLFGLLIRDFPSLGASSDAWVSLEPSTLRVCQKLFLDIFFMVS